MQQSMHAENALKNHLFRKSTAVSVHLINNRRTGMLLRRTPSAPGFSVLDSPLANLVGDGIQHGSSWKAGRILIGNYKM